MFSLVVALRTSLFPLCLPCSMFYVSTLLFNMYLLCLPPSLWFDPPVSLLSTILYIRRVQWLAHFLCLPCLARLLYFPYLYVYNGTRFSCTTHLSCIACLLYSLHPAYQVLCPPCLLCPPALGSLCMTYHPCILCITRLTLMADTTVEFRILFLLKHCTLVSASL